MPGSFDKTKKASKVINEGHGNYGIQKIQLQTVYKAPTIKTHYHRVVLNDQFYQLDRGLSW
jgi:hypothetical protein